MNPFDWTGPPFLFFYVVLTIVVIVSVRILRNHRELADGGYRGTPIHDPYAVAFLRGGTPELVQVAVVSLVDRGLLAVTDEQVSATPVGRSTSVRRRIEKELLELCAAPRDAEALVSSAAVEGAAVETELELRRMGMLPDDDVEMARRKLFFAAAAVLLFFSVVKIVVALSRGRTNIVFLIVLTIVAMLLLRRVATSGRTARGDAFLAEVQNLFRSLKLRAAQLRPGGATSEVAMLAAVWGVTALPRETFGWIHQLFRGRRGRADDGGGGSSCGSSCGSGCGGGCGGGGCGGCGG